MGFPINFRYTASKKLYLAIEILSWGGLLSVNPCLNFSLSRKWLTVMGSVHNNLPAHICTFEVYPTSAPCKNLYNLHRVIIRPLIRSWYNSSYVWSGTCGTYIITAAHSRLYLLDTFGVKIYFCVKNIWKKTRNY